MLVAKVHIGKKIKEVVKESHLSAIKLASMLNMKRDNIYKIYGKDYVDTSLLRKISEVLQHDFFKYYSQELSMVSDPKEPIGFVTREELNDVQRSLENTIQTELRKIREELVLQKNSYTKKKISRKKK